MDVNVHETKSHNVQEETKHMDSGLIVVLHESAFNNDQEDISYGNNFVLWHGLKALSLDKLICALLFSSILPTKRERERESFGHGSVSSNLLSF